MKRLPLLFSCALALTVPVSGQESNKPGEPGEGAEAEVAEEKDWLEYYYQDPDPEHFVEQMKNWSEDGTLDIDHAKPILISFISQLVRQNRDKVAGWHSALQGLPPEHKQLLNTALMFSRTNEADEILRNQFGERYDEEKQETHKILEMPLDKPATLDMLWGFFYATGSENAIRRIVVCFRFEDAPVDPNGVDVPSGYVPLYKSLPDAAFISLRSNAERHPKVLEILEEVVKDESVSATERRNVYDVLTDLKPEKYPYKDHKATGV